MFIAIEKRLLEAETNRSDVRKYSVIRLNNSCAHILSHVISGHQRFPSLHSDASSREVLCIFETP
jgi:hypothetical protein